MINLGPNFTVYKIDSKVLRLGDDGRTLGITWNREGALAVSNSVTVL